MGVAASTTEPAEDAKPAKCGANGRAGKPCGRPAGWGTDHVGWGACKHHSGSTKNGRRHAARLQAEAEAAAFSQRFAELEPDDEPHDVLLRMVRLTNGLVSFYGRKYRELLADRGEDALAVAEERERVWTGGGESGGGEETTRSNTVVLHVWGRLYHEAIDRAAKTAKLALDAGVEERRVRLAEQWGDELADVLRAVLGDLDLSPAQLERAPAVVERHLRLIEGGMAA